MVRDATRCLEGKAPIFGLRLIVQPRPPPASQEDPTMPYLRLDLAKTYPSQTKRDLAARLCRLYADVMQTQLWRPNVGIAELGEDNLFHLGADGLEPITMVLVEIRRGRSLDRRLELARRIVDICVEVLGVPRGDGARRIHRSWRRRDPA